MSELIEDNSNSPDLFCHKQPPQTTESEDGRCNDDSTPGPGAYSPENAVKAVYRSSPAYTFRTKSATHNSYHGSYWGRPGPGSYAPERIEFAKYKPGTPSYSFGSRHSWYKAPFIVQYK